MAKVGKLLLEISKLRGCSYEEARELYKQVRSLYDHMQPSTKCIAQAVEQLENSDKQYSLQDVAQLATELHKVELKQRPRAKSKQKLKGKKWIKLPSRVPIKRPRYVVHADGTVTTSKALEKERYWD